MREIILDTETTGLSAHGGDRLIEIGCVELINLIPTGRSFHRYINPERPVSEGAFAVHGISNAFLADKPRFADIVEPFLDFIGDARLVIHNASFDKGFLDMEFERLGITAMSQDRIVDTLILARRKHPGGSNSLDALCARYGIDATRRTKHGALLDAEILSEVYAELVGGRQAGFALTQAAPAVAARAVAPEQSSMLRPKPLEPRLTEAEQCAHAEMLRGLGDEVIWTRYLHAPKKA